MGNVIQAFSDALVNVGLEHCAQSKAEAKRTGKKFYFTGKPCKYGHVSVHRASGLCLACTKTDWFKEKVARQNKAHYAKNGAKWLAKRRADYASDPEMRRKAVEQAAQWRADNPGKSPEQCRAWYAKNREHSCAKRKAWREAHPEHTKKKMRAYYDAHKSVWYESNKRRRAENPEKINAQMRAWHARHKGEPKYEARRFIKNMLTGIVRGKDEKYSAAIGYTSAKLAHHLEAQFEPWMTWKNHGSAWHIDNIIPIACFLEHGITDPKIVNALWNLRPLEASANMSKGALVSYDLMDRIKARHGVDVKEILLDGVSNG